MVLKDTATADGFCRAAADGEPQWMAYSMISKALWTPGASSMCVCESMEEVKGEKKDRCDQGRCKVMPAKGCENQEEE